MLLYNNCNCLLALSICLFAFPFIDWGWVQALLCTGHNQKKIRNIKGGEPRGIGRKDEEDSLGISQLPCLESVWLIKDLSARAELSWNLPVVLQPLVYHSRFLLWWDKNLGREVNWCDTSNEYSRVISFKIHLLGLLAVQGTLKSLPQHHSSKSSILLCSPFFMVQLSHPYMTTGKTIALTRRTFVDKVMALLFNMLSRLVITFLPRSKHLLISWLQSPSTVILEPKKV